MKKQGKKKSEKHHWWPRCVSKHWKNENGLVHMLLPNGEVTASFPENFGCLGNGHYIKLGRESGETTPFDENFESIFHDADHDFPDVISWLQSLERKDVSDPQLTDRFIPQNVTDEQIGPLVESIVSLAIRSPMQRETGVRTAEAIRGGGRLPERERNSLITMNMRDSHEKAVSQIGTRGKFAVLYSPEREFIFGDGFFHNVRSPVQYQPNNYKMLVPITPEISVLYVCPRQYITEPRFFTLVITPEEADIFNNTIQIYSSERLFFRSEKPTITPDYKSAEHLEYGNTNNPVDTLISAIPGVRNRQSFF